jgi:hypothetical protein
MLNAAACRCVYEGTEVETGRLVAAKLELRPDSIMVPKVSLSPRRLDTHTRAHPSECTRSRFAEDPCAACHGLQKKSWLLKEAAILEKLQGQQGIPKYIWYGAHTHTQAHPAGTRHVDDTVQRA